MAKPKRKGGRGGGQGKAGAGGGSQPSGIEKYGKDEADDYLNLSDGDEASEAESDVCEVEDVMEIENAEDEEEWAPPKAKASTASKAKAPADDSDEEGRLEPGSKGWNRGDFYGGDDAGDDSDNNSDEELVFQEAKRLEELRARQLTGGDDVLAALLASSTAGQEPALADATAGSGLGGATTSAHFESVFAGEAEKVSVPRGDLSELSAAERKSLIKKEAPELMPLLSDFKAKLGGLQEILPLLQPAVLKALPAGGAAYLEAKAALLLNTLANLSFYLLLRAEGGAVRAHPVVPQLVWLRELHEQLSALDVKLSPKVRKTLFAAGKALRAGALPSIDGAQQRSSPSGQPVNGGRTAEAPVVPRKKTLRERLERLQMQAPAPAPAKTSAKKQNGELSHGALTKDLLKLPKARPKDNGGSASGPADLDDVDPTLGVWAPRSSVSEQLSEVQQQLRAHSARAKVANASADQLTDAKPRRAARDRKPKLPEDELPPPIEEADDDDDDELIKEARQLSKSKKERKSRAEAVRTEQKEAAKLLKEFQPEEVAEGRRKTSKRILLNRGLSRVRKKKAGNARVSNKEKYEKAIKRRKGAVQDMRQGDADGATYEGEATGIRTHVRKSQKIG